MSPRCPNCGEWTTVSRVRSIEPTLLEVSQLSPPPYCPVCGHPWWREGLADEAQRVIDEADGGGGD